MTKLIDLNSWFVDAGGKGIKDGATGKDKPERRGVGVSFDCPCGCDQRAFIPFTNPIDGGDACYIGDNHPTWLRNGDKLEALTLTPSIHRSGGCSWHGFLINGEIKKSLT